MQDQIFLITSPYSFTMSEAPAIPEPEKPEVYHYQSDSQISCAFNFVEDYIERAAEQGWIRYPYPSGFGYGFKKLKSP